MHALSTAFTTEKLEETKAFYIQHLDAKVTFDCGWYVNLEFGNPACTLQFVSPEDPEHLISNGDGLTYKFVVDNVEAEYERLVHDGQHVALSLENHGWGERGFGIKDPNGITIYIYSKHEPGPDFRKFFKEDGVSESA